MQDPAAKNALLRVARAVGVNCASQETPDVILGMILGRMQAESPYAELCRKMLIEINVISTSFAETSMDGEEGMTQLDNYIRSWQDDLRELENPPNGTD